MNFASTVVLVLCSLSSTARAQCEMQKLLPPTPVPAAKLGISVGASGPYAIAGAPFDSVAANSAGTGHIYELTAAGWTHVYQHLASDAEILDRSGWAVAIAGDTALVGTRYNEDSGYGTGSVYVIERQRNGTWQETAKLVASDQGGNDFFGNDVAVNDLGIMAIGAPNETSQGGLSGAVYVFEKIAGTWTETQKLVAPDGTGGERFGYSLALSGERLVIGARRDNELGTDSGSAYVFDKVAGTWIQTQKLFAPDGAPDSHFGVQVDIDGDTLVVGALADDGVALDAGAAYVFQLEGGTWQHKTKLSPVGAASGDFFGDSVAIEGNFIVVGAFGSDPDGSTSGAAYLFEQQGQDWIEVDSFERGDPAPGDAFGNSLTLDGGRLFAGARSDDDFGLDTGAVYVFTVQRSLLLASLSDEVSIQTGGAQDLILETCPPRAGDFYFLLGSVSGTSPGITTSGLHFPLNPDFYFFLTISAPDFYPLQQSTGNLDASGRGTGKFGLEVGENPAMAGIVLNHAFGLFDGQLQLVTEVSNPIPVTLVP